MAKYEKIRPDASGNYRGVVYRYVNDAKDDPEYGYCWVGDTLNEAERRKCWNSPNRKRYGGKKITEARARVGAKKFKYQVLEVHLDTDEKRLRKFLDEREAYYITLYDSINNGYNTSTGGRSNRGTKMSAQSIAKRTATRKKNGVKAAHTPSKYKGQKRDQAFCQAVSAGLKGKTKTEEHKQALSAAMKGRVMTAEARAKSSATKKGKPHPISAQGKANIDAARYKIPVVVTNDKTGFYKEYPSMKSIEAELGVKPGSVHNFLRTGNANKDGYRFAYKDGVKPLPKKKQKP